MKDLYNNLIDTIFDEFKMSYCVYVIELDREFAGTRKARKANPHRDPNKPCVYVGYTSKIPETRFKEHMGGARNENGPIYSKVVKEYGIRLRPRLYEKYNPIGTQEQAMGIEVLLAERLRKRGYTVWQN